MSVLSSYRRQKPSKHPWFQVSCMYRFAHTWEQSIWSRPLLGICCRESGSNQDACEASSIPEGFTPLSSRRNQTLRADFLTSAWNPPWLFKSMLGCPFGPAIAISCQNYTFCLLLYGLHKTMSYLPKSSVCFSTAMIGEALEGRTS